MSKKNIFISFILISSISFIALSSSSEAQVCQVNITWPSNTTYTIGQNNTYYCLNQSWYLTATAIQFASGVQNTTLDCLNYNLNGDDGTTDYGVYLTGSETKNNTVKNCYITNFGEGVYLRNYASKNLVINNTFNSSSYDSIWLDYSSNNTIANNTITYVESGGDGMYITNSQNNTIENNTVKKGYNGIHLVNSRYNSLKYNIMANNTIGSLFVEASTIPDYDNYIDTTNYAAGFPIYYYYSKKDLVHDGLQTKSIRLINCTNITVNNINLTRSVDGRGDVFEIVATNNSKITNIEANRNYPYAITVDNSNNNTFENITTDYTIYYGFYLYYSSNNTITNLKSRSNTYNGLLIESSSSNNITGGSISDNQDPTYGDYWLRSAGSTNYIRNTNFTDSRKIYFQDAISWFSYNNETTGNIWLKTSVSSAATITRKLTSWNQSLMKWNDSSSAVTARYNITGLLPNRGYVVYNDSASVYTLQTDSFGNLPSFTIFLSSEHQISVEAISININITTNQSIYRRGQTVLAYGTFYFGNGTGIANKNVSVQFIFPNGTTAQQRNATTNASGYYNDTYSLSSTAPSGTYSVNVTGYYDSLSATNSTTFSLNYNIIVTLEANKTSKRDIISRPNSNIPITGYAYYANDNSAYASQQLTFTYDTRSLGTNTTNASGYYWFTFSIPYEGSYNLTVKARDASGSAGENSTIIFISTHPLTVKYNLNFTLGSTKANDLYKKGSKYVCGYDNTEYSDGLVLSLIHSYKAQDLQDIGFESASSQGLVGYWKFDEGIGTTAYDSSGYNNDGILKNKTGSCGGTACPSWTTGKFNSGLEFDGIGDYVDLGSDLSILQNVSEATLTAWVKADTLSASERYIVGISKNNSGTPTLISRAFVLLSDSDEVKAGGRSADGEDAQFVTTTTSPISTGTWYHIATVINYANDSVTIYVNGQSQAATGTVNFSQNTTSNTASTSNAVGSEDDGSSSFFDGVIDDVRIWNRALTADEIKTEYGSKFKLKQKIENSQLLLAFTKGTCQAIEGRMYLVESYAIPSRAFSSFSYPIPAAVPILIQFKNDRIQINGSDRFSAGDHKVCVEMLGKSLGNKPIMGVGKC